MAGWLFSSLQRPFLKQPHLPRACTPRSIMGKKRRAAAPAAAADEAADVPPPKAADGAQPAASKRFRRGVISSTVDQPAKLLKASPKKGASVPASSSDEQRPSQVALVQLTDDSTHQKKSKAASTLELNDKIAEFQDYIKKQGIH